MSGIRLAFFDVDETLIKVKSMFAFLADYLDPADYRRAEGRLKALAAAGVPRESTNREYYRLFAGHDVSEISRRGRAWFEREAPDLFRAEVLDRLRDYQRGGAAVVLVSGSFPACLDPIAEYVGADRVLCSRPEVEDGRYTGELRVPVIGEGKAAAVRDTMAEFGVEPGQCAAFGDHVSDVPMLDAVGTRFVVGDDPALHSYLSRPGWFRLADLAPTRG